MIDWSDVERHYRNEAERAWRAHNAPFYRLRFALARLYVLSLGRLLRGRR